MANLGATARMQILVRGNRIAPTLATSPALAQANDASVALDMPLAEPTTLRPVPVCAGRLGAAGLSPEGAGPCLGRPGAAAIALVAGFTLLELLVVVAIIAIGSAGVGFAMRDSAHAQLEREAQRLTALLESARAQSRSTGVPVRWIAQNPGFRFEGLPPGSLPTQWLSASVEVSAPAGSTTTLSLGPEPLIGRQTLTLGSADVPGRQITIGTDGLRPFALVTATP